METRAGFSFAFACKRSGNCCAIPGGFVRVSAAEAAAIAQHLGISEEAFRSRYVQAGGERLKEGLGHRCVFLADGVEASCSIYEVRPAKCRSWPFWDEVKDDAALRALVRRTCPGIVDLPSP
jgi:hypothetical protein